MRAIDADRLVEIFDTIPDKESTAIFIPKIVEVIEEQPTIIREDWIDVHDELPEDGTWNIFTDGKCVSVERFKMDAMDHFYPSGRYFNFNDTIAWMPLPEPYHMADK